MFLLTHTSMAAVEGVFCFLSANSSSSPKTLFHLKPLPSIRPHISSSTLTLSLKFPLYPLHPTRKLSSPLCSVVEEVAVDEETEQSNQKRKLFVLNLPWSSTVEDVKKLFGECGTVTDVEIIKHKDGKNRGFAFVTMASGEESQAVIDKFNSVELSGRIIKIEFAKRFKRPPPPPPPAGPPPREPRHKVYVSNLAWKVRSNDLRELFTANHNPVSARVVFDSPSGKSAGYGFVSFATKEEAEAAISALNGKELLGRPISLKFSLKNAYESEVKEEATSEGQPEEIMA